HRERGQLAPRRRVQGAQALLSRLFAGQDRARLRWRSWLGAALVLTVLAVAGAALRVHRQGSVLSCAVLGGRLDASGAVQADGPASPPRLAFSDGTEVALAAGARAVVRSVTRHGARVSLSEGAARVNVVHLPEARWLFEAGPFLITVTGTAFTVSWSSADERLDLHMDRGAVEVSGPLSDDAIVVRRGQRLIVRVRQRETVIRDRDDAVAASSPPTGDGAYAPLTSDGASSPPAPARAPDDPRRAPDDPRDDGSIARAAGPRGAPGGGSGSTSPGRTESRDWTAAVAAGDFEGVVRRAEQSGIEGCLARAPVADLAALADAARYGRHDDLARRALLAERRRFPRSAQSRDASFLLGRLEEAGRDPGKALAWYDRYLAESPAGTYASEALGRKMDLVQKQSGDAAARAVAREYLGRFPQGTYAERARALAQAP
ncbi:MAG: FecR domain-containing protein, partial [Myxococcales bacterium]|nr:FecR domain-containing protein [Myxococcales bacterium]